MHSQSTGALARYIEKTGKECLMPTGQYLKKKKKPQGGTPLLVQWLSLHAPKAGSWGLIAGQGARCQTLQLRL